MLPFFRTRPRLVIGSNPPPFSNHLSGPGRLLTGGQVRNWGIHQDGKVKHLQDKKSQKLTKLNKKKLKKWSRKMWLAWWSSNYITPMTDWLICSNIPQHKKNTKSLKPCLRWYWHPRFVLECPGLEIKTRKNDFALKSMEKCILDFQLQKLEPKKSPTRKKKSCIACMEGIQIKLPLPWKTNGS